MNVDSPVHPPNSLSPVDHTNGTQIEHTYQDDNNLELMEDGESTCVEEYEQAIQRTFSQPTVYSGGIRSMNPSSTIVSCENENGLQNHFVQEGLHLDCERDGVDLDLISQVAVCDIPSPRSQPKYTASDIPIFSKKENEPRRYIENTSQPIPPDATPEAPWGYHSNGKPRREKKLFPNEVLQFKDLVNDHSNQNLTSSLYLGERYHAKNKEILQYHNVYYILNCTPPKDIDTTAGNRCYFEDENCFRYKRISVFDNIQQYIIPYIDEAIDFIDEGKKYGSVFVHCNKGRSRSASFIIAYIMKKTGMNPDEAYQYLHSRRPCVHPNEYFWQQLWFYYKFILPHRYVEARHNHILQDLPPPSCGILGSNDSIPTISICTPGTLNNEYMNLHNNNHPTTGKDDVHINAAITNNNFHPVQTVMNNNFQSFSHNYTMNLPSSYYLAYPHLTHPYSYPGSLLAMESLPLVDDSGSK